MRIAFVVALLTTCYLATNARGDDQEELEPAAGTVTYTFTYFPKPAEAGEVGAANAGAATEETRTLTVPINLIDKYGSKTVRFADLECIVSYSVDTTILDIFARNPSRDLFRRMRSSASNGSDNGIIGTNRVYNPLTGSSVQFTAFIGSSAADVGESSDKPKMDIADLNLEKTIDSFSSAELEVARKHADYGIFGGCDRIVIGRIKVHELMVLESFPPIYEYDLRISLDGIIRGPPIQTEPMQVSYSQSEGSLPKFDPDVLCVIGLAGTSLQVWTPADQAVVDAAIVATLDREGAKDDDLSLAMKNPEQHQHYGFFRNSKNLALVRPHGAADTVTFTTSTKLEAIDYKIVRNYRGDLSSGAKAELAAKSSVHELSFIAYEKQGMDWVITDRVAVSEPALFVAAKALNTRLEALKTLIAADKLELKNEEARNARELQAGPEQSESRSSQGFDPTAGLSNGSDDVEGTGTREGRPE